MTRPIHLLLSCWCPSTSGRIFFFGSRLDGSLSDPRRCFLSRPAASYSRSHSYLLHHLISFIYAVLKKGPIVNRVHVSLYIWLWMVAIINVRHSKYSLGISLSPNTPAFLCTQALAELVWASRPLCYITLLVSLALVGASVSLLPHTTSTGLRGRCYMSISDPVWSLHQMHLRLYKSVHILRSTRAYSSHT
jgi:hypothetical protein